MSVIETQTAPGTNQTGETTGGTPSHSNTNDGFIIGVEPAKTPDQLRAEQAAAQPVPTPNPQQQSTGERTFSATEVEGFRQQEKDKLYGRIDSMSGELEELKAEREAARKATEEAQAEAERKAKEDAESGMDVRDLLTTYRQEAQAEIQSLRDQAERSQAELEKERQFQELNQYRSQAVEAVRDRIVPEIADFIGGDTPEQIDASIADALERSDRIVQGMMTAQQNQLQGMRGVRTTAPAGNGPLEEQQEHRAMSAEDIRNMSPSEYAASRGKLQEAGRAQFYGRQ
jgi:chromosome segregation ATPase